MYPLSTLHVCHVFSISPSVSGGVVHGSWIIEADASPVKGARPIVIARRRHRTRCIACKLLSATANFGPAASVSLGSRAAFIPGDASATAAHAESPTAGGTSLFEPITIFPSLLQYVLGKIAFSLPAPVREINQQPRGKTPDERFLSRRLSSHTLLVSPTPAG